MHKYTIIEEKNDAILVALNTIYDFSEIINEFQKDILQSEFNGYLIFDCLLYCVSIESLDRFIGYKVLNGVVMKDEKYIFIQSDFNCIDIGNKYFRSIDERIIDNSMLSIKSKAKLKNIALK